MSDMMLFGVLRMPARLALHDELSRMQFYGRAQQAADRLECAETALRAILDLAIDEYGLFPIQTRIKNIRRLAAEALGEG